MKKLLSVLFIVFLLFSCNDKDEYVKFDSESYSLYYNGIIKLDISTSETDLSSFYYHSADTNVVKVDNNGNVYGVYVGETTVTVGNGNVSAKCKVTVIPHEDFFKPWLIGLKGLSKDLVEFIEERELKAKYPLGLCYLPLVDEIGIDSLVYLFDSDILLYQYTAYLKVDIENDAALLFLTERYAEKQSSYYDHNSGAIVTYEQRTGDEPGRFVYVFQ